MRITYQQITETYEQITRQINSEITNINTLVEQGNIEEARQTAGLLHIQTIYGLRDTIGETIGRLEDELSEDAQLELDIFMNEHGNGGTLDDYLTNPPANFNTTTAILMLNAVNDDLFGAGEQLATDIGTILREHAATDDVVVGEATNGTETAIDYNNDLPIDPVALAGVMFDCTGTFSSNL